MYENFQKKAEYWKAGQFNSETIYVRRKFEVSHVDSHPELYGLQIDLIAPKETTFVRPREESWAADKNDILRTFQHPTEGNCFAASAVIAKANVRNRQEPEHYRPRFTIRWGLAFQSVECTGERLDDHENDEDVAYSQVALRTPQQLVNAYVFSASLYNDRLILNMVVNIDTLLRD